MDNKNWRFAKFAWLPFIVGPLISITIGFAAKKVSSIDILYHHILVDLSLILFSIITPVTAFIFIILCFSLSKKYKNTIKHATAGLIVLFVFISLLIMVHTYAKLKLKDSIKTKVNITYEPEEK